MKMILASLLMEAALLLLLFWLSISMNALALLAIMLLPVLLNAIFCFSASRSNANQSAVRLAGKFAFMTVFFLIAAGICLRLSGNAESILSQSLSLNSEYMVIGSDNSPVLSGLIIGAVSFVFNYFTAKIPKGKKHWEA